ncbi:MAG TPA: acyl-CoA dehydrogenase family protein [Candidatus Binataceae bacterium]|nr:acyl-CoA dehydrogenase family protein [Candidatus Binataceae bacterium]
MELQLNDSQLAIRDLVRRFAREQLAPQSARIDREHAFPAQIIAELAKLGLMGIFIPERYGGAGMDHISYALALEELAVACASTAVIVSAHSSLACWPILAAGTEAQQARFLPAMAAGQALGCFALTEPEAGSDAAAQRSRARAEGEGYVIDGTKNFITNGPQAAVAIVFAVTDPGAGHRGISAFIVPTDSAGFEVVRTEEKLGIHGAHSAQLRFTQMRIAADLRLGEVGSGFKLAMQTLDGGRIGIAAQAVGIGRAALERALLYAGQRRAFGAPIGSFQAVQMKLADMAVELDAARLLTWQAAARKDAGAAHSKEAAMAKLFASEAAMRAANEALQIHGGYGYTREFPLERYYRDAKITEIYEGTSEIQRLVIAARVLETSAGWR